MKLVKFEVDFYDSGAIKFAAGQYYLLNSETQSLVNTGFADLVDPEDTPDHAAALAALAKIAHERADAAKLQADELAAEAVAAQALADAAATPAA